MARIVEATAYTAVLALSLGVGCSEEAKDTTAGAGATGAGSGGGSGATTGAGGSTNTSSGTGVVSSTGAGVGGSSYVCDPPAAEGSIFELFAESLDIDQIEPVSMCQYRGDVMLIVNVAAV
jgi:hypothetical protein